MRFQPLIALALCTVLAAPGAAQTRVAAGVATAPSGIALVPVFGLGTLSSPALNGGLSAPSVSAALFTAPAPLPASFVVAAPALAASHTLAAAVAPVIVAGRSAVNAVVPAKSLGLLSGPVQEAPAVDASPSALREGGEKFWSGSAAKESLDDAVPAFAVPAKTPDNLARGARTLAPAAGFAAIPHWLGAAAPYAEGAAVLAGAWGLTRFSRWIISKLAARYGWDKNAVVMARFISNIVIWTGGAAAALAVLGVSGTALVATFGAGGTAMALAITLAVRDVAGNLFHGVHFLLSRPFTVGDKVTIGKTTGVVHDLTLRYLVLEDETGGYILFTYNAIAAAAVKLYGQYQTPEVRLSLKKPSFPRGFLRALKDAAGPTLWKPILFAALAIVALSFFPLLTTFVKGAAMSWLSTVLLYGKAGLVAFLTAAISRSLKAGVERLATRYGWTRPVATVIKLGAAALTWIIGGSFLLNAVGVSWAWVATTLSLSTVLVSIAVNDYVSAVFQGALVLSLKPFQIGDRVKIGEHEGTVVDITLQYVVLKLDGESFMLIPHSVVKDSAIATPREYGQRRK